VDVEAVDLVQVKTADLGSIERRMGASSVLSRNGPGPLCTRFSVGHQTKPICLHDGVYTSHLRPHPECVMAKPGVGVDIALLIIESERR